MMATLNKQAGLSVIEVLIALMVATVAIVAALETIRMTNYWVMTSQIGSGGLAVAREQLAAFRHLAATDFYSATSTDSVPVDTTDTVLSNSCAATGHCYYVQNAVTDISSCAKDARVTVSWKLSERYPSSTVILPTYLMNQSDLLARGSDCLVTMFPDVWTIATATRSGQTLSSVPTFTTGIDVLDSRIYVVASNSPQFRIYDRDSVGLPRLLASSNLLGNRLNALDVMRDPVTGRTYAFIMQHTKTDQLLVLDVTGDIPVIRATRSLVGIDPAGSFPQGWRVLVYGNRLYVTTRETAGAEFHIFAIEDLTNPIEVTTATLNLARTVNEMAVVERRGTDGLLHRYVLVASSAALKELAILEVTNDHPVERLAIDLPGIENALSVAVKGDDVLLGRQVVTTGPELYHYRMSELLQNHTSPLSTSEIGADVHTIQLVEALLFLGTNKSGAELQVWSAFSNSGRVATMAAPRLASHGIDLGTSTITSISQSATQPEQLIIWSAE